MIEELTGITAGVLTSVATLPQIIKTYRTRNVEDISLFMFTVLLLGLMLWVAYGIMNDDKPIIFTNIVACVLNSIMIYFKVRYR